MNTAVSAVCSEAAEKGRCFERARLVAQGFSLGSPCRKYFVRIAALAAEVMSPAIRRLFQRPMQDRATAKRHHHLLLRRSVFADHPGVRFQPAPGRSRRFISVPQQPIGAAYVL